MPTCDRARIDVCSWCGVKRQGWPTCYNTQKQKHYFYCELCWSEYDALQGTAGSECVGSFWHEQILKAEVVAAEHEDDEGGQVLEFIKKAFDEIDSKPTQAPGQSGVAGDTESEDSEGEERDAVGPLSACCHETGRFVHSCPA